MLVKSVLGIEDTSYLLDSIRRLLGGVDGEDLTDEHILDPAIFQLAEMEILQLISCITGDDVSEGDLKLVELAFVHLVAAKLCPTVKGMIEYEVRTIDVSWKKKPVEYDELMESLLATVDRLLSNISCFEGTDDLLFRVAPSKKAVKEREKL